MAEVARKTWILGLCANLTASQARSMSLSLQRARPQTVDPVTSAAMARTDSKSPTDAIGNPASMISTPSAERALATSIFSAMFMLAPGDCSPSRRVVSKMRTRLGSAATGSDDSGDMVMARLFLDVCGGSKLNHNGPKRKNPEIHRSRRVSGLRCLLG